MINRLICIDSSDFIRQEYIYLTSPKDVDFRLSYKTCLRKSRLSRYSSITEERTFIIKAYSGLDIFAAII